MRPAENIEKLIKNTKIDTNAKVDEAVLDDVLKTFENSKKKKPAVSQPTIWRTIMKSRITRLAAAAVIIIAVVISVNQFNGSIDGASIAFSQMTDAIKKVPWIHVIYHYDEAEAIKQKDVLLAERWFSFRSKTGVYISTDGSIDYRSGNQRKWFVYDPESETLKIQFYNPSSTCTGDGKPLAEVTPENFFDYHLMIADNPEAQISRSTEVYSGKEFDIFKVEVAKEDYTKKVTFLTDVTTHLPERLDMEFISTNKTSTTSFEIEYPEEGPESIYDLGVPLTTKKIIDEMPEVDFLEVWDKHVAHRNNFYDATIKSIAIITEKNRAIKDSVWVDRMNRVTIEYKEAPRFCWYPYQLGEDMNPPDEPQTVDELPQSFEGILEWSKTIRLYPYYCGKRTATLWKDSPNHPRLTRWTWPISNPVGYYVIEDDYSIDNKLICIESIQKHDSKYFEVLRKHDPEFLKDEEPGHSYDRFLYYLNPERDYICERYLSEWRIIDNKPGSVQIKDVAEYDKTDSGKWYAKKFKTIVFEGNNQTAESITIIYLETDVDFPETVFDEKVDLPEYEADVYVPRRN